MSSSIPDISVPFTPQQLEEAKQARVAKLEQHKLEPCTCNASPEPHGHRGPFRVVPFDDYQLCLENKGSKGDELKAYEANREKRLKESRAIQKALEDGHAKRDDARAAHAKKVRDEQTAYEAQQKKAIEQGNVTAKKWAEAQKAAQQKQVEERKRIIAERDEGTARRLDALKTKRENLGQVAIKRKQEAERKKKERTLFAERNKESESTKIP